MRQFVQIKRFYSFSDLFCSTYVERCSVVSSVPTAYYCTLDTLCAGGAGPDAVRAVVQ